MFTPLSVRDHAGAGDAFVQTFPQQFMVATGAAACPPGWRRFDLCGVSVDLAPDLDVTRVFDALGRFIAVVFGLALGPDGAMLSDRHTIPTSHDAVDDVESWIESLSGRYAAVVSMDGAKRLYLDPVGDLAAVYNTQNKVAGSTTLFVMDKKFHDNKDFPFSEVKAARANYVLGHTRDSGTTRLFANHYLDLERFEPVRHWPKTGN